MGVNGRQVGQQKLVEFLFEPMNDNFRNNVLEGIEATYRTFLKGGSEGYTMAQADSRPKPEYGAGRC